MAWSDPDATVRPRRHDPDATDATTPPTPTLGSFLHHLTHVRNVAHHCRLWNRKLTVTMTIPKSPDQLAENLNRNVGAERRIYNTLAILGYLLRLASPGTTWPQRMRRLIEEHGGLDTDAMGFPDNWQELVLWKKVV